MFRGRPDAVQVTNATNLKRAAAALVILAAVAGRRIAGAAAPEVPPDRQVLILSRALAYDTNLKQRAGPELAVAVLSRPGHLESETVAAAMTRAWKSLGNIKVQGLPVRTVPLSFTGVEPLRAAVTREGIDALYVTPGLEPDIPAIITIARQRHMTTMASRPQMVERGLALGVFAIDLKPTILINLPAARSESATFAPDLLRLAKVLR